jgi:hypothetical protein
MIFVFLCCACGKKTKSQKIPQKNAAIAEGE